MASEITIRIVRMVFFLKSAAGWIVFLIGFGRLLFSIQETVSSEYKSLAQTLTGPMWLFLVSGALLYITYSIQIFACNDNIGRILHCIVVFFNFFFTAGGVLSISVGLLYHIKSLKPFVVTTLPSPTAMTLILTGTTTSLLIFWIGLGVWPLLSIRSNRRQGYTELQESARIMNS